MRRLRFLNSFAFTKKRRDRKREHFKKLAVHIFLLCNRKYKFDGYEPTVIRHRAATEEYFIVFKAIDDNRGE